jgi:hypothetical protein
MSVGTDLLLQAVHAAIEEGVARSGDTRAVRPGHRKRFHWPPHPVSADFHVLASDWTGSAEVDIDGEIYPVRIARTPYGCFGRCERLWHEARGDDEAEVLAGLRSGAAPLVSRRRAIGEALGLDRGYDGTIRDLGPEGLVRLLYCSDRDAGLEAATEIEARASQERFGPALIAILSDRRHPYRRAAQWAVLDLFEDLPSLCPTDDEQREAVHAIRALMWDAEDDFARTVFKAGVVLGGHISNDLAAEALLACLDAPSRIGRRAAIHGAFHLAEWLPSLRDQVVERLREAASHEPDSQLRDFATGIARDIEAGATDHVIEPVFAEEP